MANRYSGPSRLPAVKHADFMRAMFPALRVRRRGAHFTWTGPLQPTPISPSYKVKIDYSDGDLPRVFVVEPELVARAGCERIPHTYRDNRLCLYMPLTGEWRSDLPISHTIVPWTCLWLYYYELWHATGEWLGGGHDPGADEKTVSSPHRSGSAPRDSQ